MININRIIQETSRVQPHLLAGFHGERIRIEVSYRSYGATVSIAGAAVTFYWRTDADEPGHWHEAAGSVVDGAAVAEWGPTMDAGPDDVQWFLRVDADGDTSFRAAGALRLLPSPGFDPAVLPPATVTLDFATIQVLNAPYWTQEEADARFASVADATLNGRGFSEWTILRDGVDVTSQVRQPVWGPDVYEYADENWVVDALPSDMEHGTGVIDSGVGRDATALHWACESGAHYTATRTALPGYVLGSQTEKPIPKLSDVPAVVAPSTDAADAGKAADAKAVGDALVGKLNASMSGSGNGDLEWGMHSLRLSNATLEIAVLKMVNTSIVASPNNVSATLPAVSGELALVSQIPDVSSETWTFEIDDGQGGTTTVTKSVAVFAAAQNAQAAQGVTP